MSETLNDAWGSTASAIAGYAGVGEIHFFRYFLGLALVLVVALAAAWAIKKAWPGLAVKTAGAGGHILYLSQFNAEQTLMLCVIHQAVHCFIVRGDKIELAAALPGVVAAPQSASHTQRQSGPPVSFKTFWEQLIRPGKDKA
jgi:hypothetical protein